MTRGEAKQVIVHYKGKEEDFIIVVESAEAVEKWKKDSSIPMIEVVNGWEVLVSNRSVL